MSPHEKFRITDLLAGIHLPSLPEAVSKLGEAISNDAPLETIVTLVENEPTLTARVLQLANSAWYHQGRHVETVKEAINNIGFVTTYQLVVISSIIDIFEGIDSRLVNMQTFWKQSVRMACAAKALSEYIKNPTPTRLFTSGILAYIGKLILYIGIPIEMQKILLIVKDEGIQQYLVEDKLLGHNHIQVGIALLRSWRIPEEICAPIEFLYTPDQAPLALAQAAGLLNTAHYMQYTFWHDIALTDPPGQPCVDSLQALGISLDILPEISRDVDVLYREAMRLFIVK